MSITLKIRDDLTMNQLRALARTRPLVKTPHVGNNSINNLLAAAYGFPILWVDNTIPLRDTNANPHLLIKSGTPHVLTDDASLDKKLTSHVQVSKDARGFTGFPPGSALVEGHLTHMRKVFPHTDIVTTSENYATHSDLTMTVLEEATKALPHKWYRKLSTEGLLTEYNNGEDTGIREWNDIRNDVYLLPRKSGWVIPNLFAITHDLVKQVRDTDSVEAWMLSGPDMIHYLPSILKDMQVAYGAISRRVDYPRDVILNVVPFTHFKFVVRKSSHKALGELWELLRNGSHNQHARANLATLCPDLWTNTKRRVYFTQHDMASLYDICVVEEALDMPLRDVEKLWLKARADLPKELR